ncbi:MAG: hypothetical protein ACREUK_05840, partial [Burkholderiales bacterium]
VEFCGVGMLVHVLSGKQKSPFSFRRKRAFGGGPARVSLAAFLCCRPSAIRRPQADCQIGAEV